MTLFFFDFKDKRESVADDIGSELAGLDEAKEEAMEFLIGIARDRLPGGEVRELSITIRDSSGPLALVSLRLISPILRTRRHWGKGSSALIYPAKR